jgi:hypothetical protein
MLNFLTFLHVTGSNILPLEDLSRDIPLDLKEVVSLDINLIPITNKAKELDVAKLESSKKLDPKNKDGLIFKRAILQKELETIAQSLNKEQKAYQEYLKSLEVFKNAQNKILGEKSDKSLTTITSLKEEIAYLTQGLPNDLDALDKKRAGITKRIFEQLLSKIGFYKEIYQPLIHFIEQEKETQEQSDSVLDFAVGLIFDKQKFSDQFFSFINQSKDGSFQGKESGQKLLKSILNKFELASDIGLFGMIEEIIKSLKTDVTKKEVNTTLLDSQLKGNKKDFYDFFYGLEYLNVQYTIQFNGKSLNDNEFSPGEKGALLLIFYLLIDRNKIPLIMDQPEENLDNESVYVLLVPYIKRAKMNRQIFVVTHNPNLAVVCDAEQVICTSMNKKTNEVRYSFGSIENPEMNKKISNILEGTLPAFDIRDRKYLRD